MNKKPQVSICIPVYYSGPEVPRVLDKLLTTIDYQDYPHDRLHVMISIQQCKLNQFAELTSVMCAPRDVPWNPSKQRACNSITPGPEVNSPATNTNSALSLAADTGYIKIMNQDDMLNSHSAISNMVATLEGSDAKWLASACCHTDAKGEKRERYHMPFWPGEKNMVEAMNRIGCPSVIMFDASLKTRFDPHPDINYAMDCCFYIDLQREAGLPVIHPKPDVVVRMWDNQLSNQMNIPQQIELSKKYMRKKYDC